MVNSVAKAVSIAKKNVGNPSMWKWVARWDGKSGTITKSGSSFPVDAKGVLDTSGGAANSVAPRLLTWAELEGCAKKIDALYVGSDHLDVKADPQWSSFYQQAPRNIAYMNAVGTIVNKSIPTIPCHNCGVVLPVEFYQVDHHMPQAGGADLHTLKVVRALGGTVLPPSGAKGKAYQAGGLAGKTADPRARNRTYNHLTTPSPRDKWTTTDEGSAFISLVRWVGAADDLARMCKNSVLNLVPLCSLCNQTKSDWVRPRA